MCLSACNDHRGQVLVKEIADFASDPSSVGVSVMYLPPNTANRCYVCQAVATVAMEPARASKVVLTYPRV